MKPLAHALAFCMLFSTLAAAEEISLVKDGATPYVIVLPAKPDPVQQTAARELQEHLAEATGAKLAVVSEAEVAADAPQIVLGPSERMKQLLPELNVDALGHDAIVMKTVGENLVLAGRPPRGTLYAVYTFLEDVVGCRWWTPTEKFVPKKPTLSIPELNVTYVPALRYREAFYRHAFEGVFSARTKCNGYHNHVTPEYGDHYRFVGFVHTFYPLLPPEKYFKDHPEWYSKIKGKRTTERAQLCLTNDEMRKELTKNALERLRKDPGAGLISISQNDWHGRCQCAKCRAVEEEEGSPAGLLLRFVNAVAADIEKEFPDVLVETLAYQYTRKPPLKVKPRRNVVVRLCSIECSFVQPLAEGDQNEKFRSDIEGWSKIAPQLFVWDYITNFSKYLVPHPNYRVLAPNIRFFAKNHTIGLFEQGDAGSSIGDFVRLRAWLVAHLMWNPEADEKALTREFLEGYYGPAADHLEAYLNLICDAGERSGIYLRCFMPNTSGWLTLDDLNRATALFDKAEAAVAGDPVLARRVRRERLPLDHVWLSRYHGLKRQARLQNKVFLGPKDPVAACEKFIKAAHEFNVGQYRERRPFAEYEERLRRRFRPAAAPPKQCEGLPADAWIDIQDNEFRLAQQGKWSSMVDDAKASDGKAARMPGSHHQWAVSCPLSDDFNYGNPWHCYVVARTEAKAKEGPAMTMGIYDTRNRKGVAHKAVGVEESAGADYRVYDMGVHDLRGGMYFWVAPPKRPGEVEAVYVDRIFLVREKAPLAFHDVKCEGIYKRHLQGICTNHNDSIYWCFTTDLVKTDRNGKVLKKAPVAYHHGDLCYHRGKVYVAVNLGKFNDPRGNADSWVYVYDADDLSELARHKTPEVFHGAGGIAYHDGRFLVVSGLPGGVEENYAYEYDMEFRFVKRHVIRSGHTFLGIQTATFADGCWWFGCYGEPPVLLKTDEAFKMVGKYPPDVSLGIVGVGGKNLLVAKGSCRKGKGCVAEILRAEADPDKGLLLQSAAQGSP